MVRAYEHLKKVRSLVLMLALMLVFVLKALPLTARADEQEGKVVRVGWYDSAYNIMDENGFRSGYGYEYQLKLSAYNGWTYEYVAGSWPDLFKMLKKGEIDLLSDVSHAPEREEYMYFSSLPMGTEEYYIFILPEAAQASLAKPSSLNGKRVGVNKGSVQATFFADWTRENNIRPDVVFINVSEEESMEMLERGELDAIVTVDSFVDSTRAVPVYKVGSSDYYFAVTKSRPDLLEELDFAMSKIQDENRYYNLEMYEKYLRGIGANVFLSTEEKDWLEGHKTIRVGYQDNYMAFCAADKETGELIGVLKDYLYLAGDCMPNTKLEFSATAYPSTGDALTAMKNGDVDCVFPANLSAYEAEEAGMVMTPPVMNTEMYAVVRMSEPNIFKKEGQVIAAVNEGNTNYEAFLAKNFPDWGKAYFQNTEKCLKGISNGEADCLIISNFRYNDIARLCNKYRLTTFSVGVQMDYCFAVEKGNTELYSIMAKTTAMVPDSAIDASFTHYISEAAKPTIQDFLIEHLTAVLILSSILFFVILTLLIQNILSGNKAKRLIKATQDDDLTGLYTRKYFLQYAESMYRDNPDVPMDAIVLNIEQFHSVNAVHGRDLGDEILRALGKELKEIAAETNGIAGRFEADRFDLYCRHLEEYQTIFDRLQAKVDEVIPNANIRIRMGVMPWRKDVEPVQLFDRANTACNMVRGHYMEHLVVFDDTINEREAYEQRLVNDLRRALDENDFQVYYQPKYDIQSDPPRLVSAEALVRWAHPELGMISPGDFIPLFERNGQINLLDKYVWTKAAEQIARWKREYGVTIPVSVNLSRVDVFDPELEETLDSILKRNGLGRNAFKLEVTESAYTENADQVIQVVGGLRNKGYEVEMDDFGTGYSSLNMLSYMPIDVLKMDRGFIQNLDQDEKNRQLVGLILDIAKNLKVLVVAEGVETEEQLHLLKDLGCAIVQGYYFSRPLPPSEFETRYLTDGAGTHLEE
ncbi:MAG: EAL domain-containing protein [Lachnospiraceae bacterium]|nr:EAL domain-containing protein [Lachnospiraceae bacterium]